MCVNVVWVLDCAYCAVLLIIRNVQVVAIFSSSET